MTSVEIGPRRWFLIGLAALGGPAMGCGAEKCATDVMPGIVAPSPCPAPATTDEPFEGEIQVAVYTPLSGKRKRIAYAIKGDMVRSQPVGGNDAVAEVVGDRKGKKVFQMVDASKTFATVDVAAERPATPILTRSGKTQRILGRECENWTITDDGERIDVCVAKGIAYIDAAAGTGEPAWAGVLTREHAFPLRVIATGKDGRREFRAEVTKIEARPLDDEIFKVPTGYQAMVDTQTLEVLSVP